MPGDRVPLYTRLPEIYRIRDQTIREEQRLAKGPLQAYIEIFEAAFDAVHANIEALYDDLFIETAADWVIPYIGDLLGTSHLSGEPRTLRADVADTVALRRRKGTLGAIELLTYDLTGWGVRCVELRENLLWHQHLNHQRPDAGGRPPLGGPGVTLRMPVRGGSVTLRDPAILSFRGTPFDPFGYAPDVKPALQGAIHHNLPNLAIFLWRLQPYTVRLSEPATRAIQAIAAPPAGAAPFVVRFDAFQIDRAVQLFNVRRDTAARPTSREPVSLTLPDEAPGPIPPPRLTDDTPAGHPAAYVEVLSQLVGKEAPALQIFVPAAQFGGAVWQFRGANLCAWETGLGRPVADREIVIDPTIGRLAVGVSSQAEAQALRDALRLSFTYGAAGPVGAHPIPREPASSLFPDEQPEVREVRRSTSPNDLRDKLADLHTAAQAVVVEIKDSFVHDLDIGAVVGANAANLRLANSLVIRAAGDERPVVRLLRPLRFRPFDPARGDLGVRLEGLFITRHANFPDGEPLIARAAVDALEIVDCTLDPGRYRGRDGTPAGSALASLRLTEDHGFTTDAERLAFDQTPRIALRRSVAGPLRIDTSYNLTVEDSIIDAGRGVSDAPGNVFAVGGTTNAATTWGPPTEVAGATFFGRTRVRRMEGEGGIWVHALEVEDNQHGCIRFSYFAGVGDRLPQNHACVSGQEALLRFVSEVFGDAAYGQLAHSTDFRVRERGPADDEMGAYGFLRQAHRWRNLQIRYREFMPLGVRPLLIPVT